MSELDQLIHIVRVGIGLYLVWVAMFVVGVLCAIPAFLRAFRRDREFTRSIEQTIRNGARVKSPR